jgi:membrane-associated phospholipid phosphatase
VVSRPALALALGLGFFLAPAAGEAEPPAPLRYDLAVDASVTGAALVSALLLVGFQSDLAPGTCRWCAPGPLDLHLRNATLWADTQAADLTSGILANGMIPISMLGFLVLSAWTAGDLRAGLVDVLLVAEAVAVTAVLTQGVKELAGRQRPWAYFGPTPSHDRPTANLSFYSGDTSFAFCTVAAALTVASRRGYAGAWIAGAAGFAAAALVGYLRMAADQHYFTDVLSGAAVGGLVGFAVPYLFHGSKSPSEPGSLRPAPGGLAIAFW